jgi:hypothetical protein
VADVRDASRTRVLRLLRDYTGLSAVWRDWGLPVLCEALLIPIQ